MKKFEYKKVDAFTSEGSMGNPAACLITGETELSHSQMLQIGKEHAGFVSEIVFVGKSKIADCKLTYYSSECEVDFCGHGTIATMYEFIKSNKDLLNKSEIEIETNRKGCLTVYNRINEENAVYITSPEGIDLDIPVTKSEIAKALGVSEEIIDNHYPIDNIEAGLKTLIVPIKKLSDEISIWPDEAHLKQFVCDHGIGNILIFSKETDNVAKIAHTRVFAPRFGYLEDPATGSSNSAFAYYMLKNGMWDGSSATLEQGGNDRVFNDVKIMKKSDRILFGGSAIKRIEGSYFLQN